MRLERERIGDMLGGHVRVILHGRYAEIAGTHMGYAEKAFHALRAWQIQNKCISASLRAHRRVTACGNML
jgi:hypothetical protein